MPEEPDISDNLIKKVAKQHGIRGTKDAESFVTGQIPNDEWAKHIEKQIEGHFIDLDLDVSDLTLEERQLLDDTVQLALKTSEAFRGLLDKSVTKYIESKGRGIFTEQMKEKMRLRREDTPRFKIMDKVNADEFLEETSLATGIDDNAYLLIINLPPVLERTWHRGGKGIWGDQEVIKDVDPGLVEWGRLYREAMPAVWAQKDFHDYDEDSSLNIERINGYGDHERGKYYYVWEVSAKHSH
jgi:hypothetical protein